MQFIFWGYNLIFGEEFCIGFAIYCEDAIAQSLQKPDLAAEIGKADSLLRHYYIILEHVIEHIGKLVCRSIMVISEEEGVRLYIVYVEWQLVLKYVECLLDLILSYEPLEVQSKILLNQLISLLLATALLDDIGDVGFDIAGVGEHGFMS